MDRFFKDYGPYFIIGGLTLLCVLLVVVNCQIDAALRQSLRREADAVNKLSLAEIELYAEKVSR